MAVTILIGTPGKVFSQTTPAENKTEVTETKNSKLFNKTGYVKGITTARAIGLGEMLLAILSIVFAVRSKKRPSINGAKTALTLGLLTVISSAVHLATVGGAVFGSGSGKAGSILALMTGLVGITIGGLTLRSRHNN